MRYELHKLIISYDSISLKQGKGTTENVNQVDTYKNTHRIFASFNVQRHLRMDKRYMLA